MANRCIDRQQNIITLDAESICQKLSREIEEVIVSSQMSILSMEEFPKAEFPASCFHSGHHESMGKILVSSVGRRICVL